MLWGSQAQKDPWVLQDHKDTRGPEALKADGELRGHQDLTENQECQEIQENRDPQAIHLLLGATLFHKWRQALMRSLDLLR